jgi:hypothetical protein
MGRRLSMKRKRHNPEEITRKLREADAQLAGGASIAEVSKKKGISENTFHRASKYGGMRTADARRLRDLEKENARLKKIVADQAIDLSILREVAK